MLLIGLTGKARAGKDTVGKYLVDELGFARYAMAGPLKRMLGALGFPEEKYQSTEEKEALIPWLGVSYRHLAQTLGTDWMRKCVAEDGWIRIARDAIRTAGMTELRGLVITDIRFENEAAMVRAEGGVVVHVQSNREGLAGQAAAHASEAGVSFQKSGGGYGGDRTLFNWGTIPELHASAAALTNDLLTWGIGTQGGSAT